MTFFNHFLRETGVSNEVRSLLYHIARSAKYIDFSLRAGNTGKASTMNKSGEQQVQLDVMSDTIICDELEKSELVSLIASEEKEEPMPFKAPRGNFTVAYDPLDGSSLVDANLAIGSIFSIWRNSALLGKKVSEGLEASCYAMYGSRVVLVIAIKGLGVHEFELNDVGEFILTRKNIEIKEGYSKYFAPGNMKCTQDDERYFELVEAWIRGCRTLRYSGGMVPDLHHILTKGEGIFSYPRDSKNVNGKLRLLYECAPMALMFEEAGGAAFNQEGERILDLVAEQYHQRTPIFIGTKVDVKNSVEFLNTKK